MHTKRLGFKKEPAEPHNVPFVILGAGVLWFGWFGFNAGGALASGALAASTFVAANAAGAMGVLTWMTMSWQPYSFIATFGILKLLDRYMGLNVSPDNELSGLDASQHGEQAYQP